MTSARRVLTYEKEVCRFNNVIVNTGCICKAVHLFYPTRWPTTATLQPCFELRKVVEEDGCGGKREKK